MALIDQGINSDIWLERRMVLERRAIEEEKSKVEEAMHNDLLATKQRLLSDQWSRLQDLVKADTDHAEIYMRICPSIFGSLSAQFPKKRIPKKPQIPKLGPEATKLDIPEHLIINDLCGIAIKINEDQVISEGTKIMITETGQKWVVNIKDNQDGTFMLGYCDGSSSQISQAQVKTLKIRFTELPSQ